MMKLAPRIEWFGKILLCSIPLVMRFMDVHDETLGLDTPVPHFGSHLDEVIKLLTRLPYMITHQVWASDTP